MAITTTESCILAYIMSHIHIAIQITIRLELKEKKTHSDTLDKNAKMLSVYIIK